MSTFTELDFKKLYENEESRILLNNWFDKYERSRLAKLEMKAVIETAMEDGFKKGLEKAKEEKAKEAGEIIKIAKSMKSEGFPFEMISKHTSLSIQEIEKL